MLNPQIKDSGLWFGDTLLVRFLRTVRVDDPEAEDPSAPDFGTFPICCACDYPDTAPPAWHTRPSVFIPMHAHEAMRIRFSTGGPRLAAVKVGIDDLNALTGLPWHERLSSWPQNYLVCPGQSRLSNYTSGDGAVRQFVARSPISDDKFEGWAIEQYNWSHIQLVVFASKHSRNLRSPAPSRIAPGQPRSAGRPAPWQQAETGPDERKIPVHPDRHGIHAWDLLNRGCVSVYLVNDLVFRLITGRDAPASAVPRGLYAGPRIPCFASHHESTAIATEERPPKTRYRPWIQRRYPSAG